MEPIGRMEPISPNSFALKGRDMEVAYATTSFTGQPLLNGQYQGKPLNFRGEKNIRRKETEIGQLVTVDLGFEPDRAIITLTLLIPHINLKDNSDSARFQTQAIITDHLTSIGGPDLVEGAIQRYRFESLEGTASIVIS